LPTRSRSAEPSTAGARSTSGAERRKAVVVDPTGSAREDAAPPHFDGDKTMSRNPEAGAFDAALLDVGADGALDAAKSAGDRTAALVDQWIARGNAAAVAELAEHGSGAARKAARRGLNVLKSRGVSIPGTRRVATLGSARGEETIEAWMMAPDAAGSVLIVVAARSPASRYRAAFVFLNDSVGVHRVESAELSQSQLRESLANVLPGARYKAVKVPVPWARARIAGARRRHAEQGVPEPLGFASAESLISPVPNPPPDHPFDEEGLELADEDARDVAKDSASLHALPEFRAWFPEKIAIDEMLAKLGETITPGEQPDQETMKQRLDQEIASATDRYFSPQRREHLVRCMKDSAFSVLSRDGEQKALEIAATVKVVQSCGLITDPPHEVPFLRGYFEKAISLLLAQGGGNLKIPVARAPAEPASEPEQTEALARDSVEP
jgi:hypothetical protein